MTKKIILLAFLFPLVGYTQQYHIPVFPDLDGEELRDNVVSAYLPDTVLNLSPSKDTLYKVVFLHKDSVECIYSGLRRYLDPDADPSQYLFGNGTSTDINMEHSYPRGMGSSTGNANSDMHHLFPSRVDVNADRGSDPFAEIPDANTDSWYYRDLTQSQRPNVNIDAYSEDNDTSFEPRESVKGDIARAIFYFYTMYKDQADLANPDFFENQRKTLCQWHEDDPVDSLEWERTFKIAKYQFDRPNPFILDCRLARLYCDSLDVGCVVSSTIDSYGLDAEVFPTILSSHDIIHIETKSSEEYHITITDNQGRRMMNDSYVGTQRRIALNFSSGLYYLRIATKDRWQVNKVVIR